MSLIATKQQIILKGQFYLQTVGYNGFSFQDIADDMKIKKASLHYHFASKEALALCLMQTYTDYFKNWVKNIDKLTPNEKLTQYFKLFDKKIAVAKKICPTGVLSNDFNTIPKSLQKEILALHWLQRKWLIQTLKKRRSNRRITSAAMADLILATTQGALQLARIRGKPKLFRQICLTLKLKL